MIEDGVFLIESSVMRALWFLALTSFASIMLTGSEVNFYLKVANIRTISFERNRTLWKNGFELPCGNVMWK